MHGNLTQSERVSKRLRAWLHSPGLVGNFVNRGSESIASTLSFGTLTNNTFSSHVRRTVPSPYFCVHTDTRTHTHETRVSKAVGGLPMRYAAQGAAGCWRVHTSAHVCVCVWGGGCACVVHTHTHTHTHIVPQPHVPSRRSHQRVRVPQAHTRPPTPALAASDREHPTGHDAPTRHRDRAAHTHTHTHTQTHVRHLNEDSSRFRLAGLMPLVCARTCKFISVRVCVCPYLDSRCELGPIAHVLLQQCLPLIHTKGLHQPHETRLLPVLTGAVVPDTHTHVTHTHMRHTCERRTKPWEQDWHPPVQSKVANRYVCVCVCVCVSLT